MSRTRFRVNPHSTVVWMSRNSLLETGAHLKFKWLQRNMNPWPLSSKTNTQPFRQTGQMIELCCEYLSVRHIWLYVLIMLCMYFTKTSDEFIDIQVAAECGFTLKGVGDLISTYSKQHLTDKYSQHSSVIRSVGLNGWVLIFELSGCGFESRCRNLNFRYCACFEQILPWHSGSCRVCIHSETCRL